MLTRQRSQVESLHYVIAPGFPPADVPSIHCHGDEAAEEYRGADIWYCQPTLLLTTGFSCHHQV